MNSLLKLRTYSESDSEEEKTSKERFKERLPLPEFLGNSSSKQLPAKEVNKEGKIRNFPHEPGNWATYIYIPVDSTLFFNYLNALFEFFKPLDLKLGNDFHVSLTRTVILRHHWIPDFITSIKSNLAAFSSFKIHFFGLKAYTNEEKTRTFLSLKVSEGEDNLKSLVVHLNNCLRDYSLPAFHEKPSFHISLLWCPGNKVNDISKHISLLSSSLKNFDFYQNVSHCVCATGNKKFTFNFYQ